MASHRTGWVIVVVVVLAAGSWLYGTVVVPRQQAKAHALAEQARLSALLQQVKELRAAAVNYRNEMSQQGTPLEPGHIVDLAEMTQHNLLPAVFSAQAETRIEKFFLAILPGEAPAGAVELEVITDRERVVMTKDGQGLSLQKIGL